MTASGLGEDKERAKHLPYHPTARHPSMSQHPEQPHAGGLCGTGGAGRQQTLLLLLWVRPGVWWLCHLGMLLLTSILSGRWQLALAKMLPPPSASLHVARAAAPQALGCMGICCPPPSWLPFSVPSNAGHPLELTAFSMQLFPAWGLSVWKRGWREQGW